MTAAFIDRLRAHGIPRDEPTDALKAQMAAIRASRSPLYLTSAEFDAIMRWKLRGQYGRQKHNLAKNSEARIARYTGAALTISYPDHAIETTVRVDLLTYLYGVGIPVASAILALVYPEQYGVIDFRVWRQLFGEVKRSFSTADYLRYQATIRPMAEALGWQVQDVDMALWQIDRVA